MTPLRCLEYRNVIFLYETFFYDSISLAFGLMLNSSTFLIVDVTVNLSKISV